jgi:hypothetical protein
MGVSLRFPASPDAPDTVGEAKARPFSEESINQVLDLIALDAEPTF